MMATTLSTLFTIEAGHRLFEEASPRAGQGLPYTSAYFREVDETGQTVFRYRLWFAFEGHVFGAERLDLEGNVLERRVDSDRHAKGYPVDAIA